MNTSSFPGLESLTDIGMRGGIDMRPTLLRVLTDLYVQKLNHTAEEEQHYTELALRLLESVDVTARTAVATRLARHLAPPPRVIAKLAADLPEVAAALRSRPQSAPAAAPPAPATPDTIISRATPTDEFDDPSTQQASALAERTLAKEQGSLSQDVAGELNELFFAASASERRLIVLNLDIVAAAPPAEALITHDVSVGRRLEAAALARRREDFTQELARSLRMSREQARRVARDELGEPIVVAAKALKIPRDLLYRILLFVNTAVGHSVERVHALAELYDEMTERAADDMVRIWQALPRSRDEQTVPARRPLPSNEGSRPRPATSVQHAPASSTKIERRDAS